MTEARIDLRPVNDETAKKIDAVEQKIDARFAKYIRPTVLHLLLPF